jgi:putative membrane-bound dehydrogenase-like protein
MRHAVIPCLVALLLSSTGSFVQGQDKTEANRPINALLVTGGCCHDYDRQKLILTRGISARANVRWTVVHQGGTTTDTPIPLYNDPNWAEGFDIVIHNECFSHVTDLAFVDRILEPHRNGTPAILIHCAMHCYRVGDDRWFEFVGLQSPGHGPHYSYTAKNLKPDHPIMQGFGDSFVAPKGELYHSVKVFDTATPLAEAERQSDGLPQVCVWTNDYHGTRVFGCTMGHYNETMAEPKYLDMMAKAVLWSVGRDPEKDFTAATAETNKSISDLIAVPLQPKNELPQGCCGEGNLLHSKPATATSEETGKNNFAPHAVDGRLDTRWCASGPRPNEAITIDMEQPQDVGSLRIHWEGRTAAYRYTVQSSVDGEQWKTVIDESENKEANGLAAHKLDEKQIRYLKIVYLGSNTGAWGSIWELEAYPGELPPLPESAAAAGKGAATISDVQAPDGFDVSLFAAPPEVNYPVCLTAAATGEVFVGVDEQGSLGKEPGRGKVLRCIDTDGDGQADSISEFVKVDHPRGLIYDDGSLWVLHPPFLSVFRDTDGDGVSDESEVLIEGISTEEVNRRGADHTTNGIRMGIDGWIYIAVGDFGFNKAVAKDGTTLSKRGGGVVRIRPDGTEMEVFSWGQRNIVDIAIDPLMNLYTRDNTNDGGGWDIRLSHVMQTANYGYPSLYMNFAEEIMPPLADYGGGSGCGAVFFQDERWPDSFNNLLLTCDWGRSEVFSHNLPGNGATFDAQQDTFLKIPRPTDIDADASGRLYVSSWKNGQFNYDGPNIGFVAMVTPIDFVPHPIADVKSQTAAELVELLNHPADVMRLHVQREVLRRGAESRDAASSISELLAGLIRNTEASLHARVAAIFTLKQLAGAQANHQLAAMSADDSIREFCLKAIADRTSQLEPVRFGLFVDALFDSNPRVQAAAIVGLGRVVSHAVQHKWVVSDASGTQPVQNMVPTIADSLLQLTAWSPSESAEGDAWRQPEAARVIPHLAVKAIVDIGGVESCLTALNGPYRSGALWALRSLHNPQAVDGLFRLLSTSRDEALRREVWTTLIRLYHREGEFTEDSPKWWGTRPDTTGPYYDRQKWSESDRIAAAIKVALSEADESLAAHIRQQLKRHVVNPDGISAADIAAMQEPQKAIEIPKVDPDNPHQIANMQVAEVLAKVMPLQGQVDAGRELFRAQSCVNCHTFANGQQPKGPHLVDIGKRYKKEELLESILDPSKKIAQGFDTWTFVMASGKVYTGFVVLESAETVTIRKTDGLSVELPQDDIDERVKQELSMMPKGIVGNLTVEQLADVIAYLQSLN